MRAQITAGTALKGRAPAAKFSAAVKISCHAQIIDLHYSRSESRTQSTRLPIKPSSQLWNMMLFPARPYAPALLRRSIAFILVPNNICIAFCSHHTNESCLGRLLLLL